MSDTQTIHTAYMRGQLKGIHRTLVFYMISLLPVALYLDHTYPIHLDGIIVALPVLAVFGYMIYVKRSAPHT